MIHAIVLSVITSATSVSIVEPVDGETYDGDWLPFRVIVENENELPDSVHYTLNGSPVVQISRLNTDWYTYMQNDLRNGYSESPAPHDASVFWTAPVTGTGHEFPSPVVVDGRVYHASEEQEVLFCLDAATGDEVWRFENIGDDIDDAVLYHNERVYLASDSVWCIDSQTGIPLWSFGKEDPHFFGGPPAHYNGMLYVNSNIDVYCLDMTTGAVIWAKHDLLSGSASSLTVHEGLVFVPTVHSQGAGYLYALDSESGDIVWLNSTGGHWDSSPNIYDDVLYIGSQDGSLTAYDCFTGEIIWEATAGYGWIESTPAIHDGSVFSCAYAGDDHCVSSFEASSGNLEWNHVIGDDYLHASPGVADGLVFWGDHDGIPKDSTVLIHAVDEETGSEVWSYQINDAWKGVLSSPAIVDGIMYIGAGDGFLYAFGTGMKYTYKEDFFYADVGSNELIVTSWDGGVAVSADTISFTVTQTGITLEPSTQLSLRATPNPIHTTASFSFILEEPGFVSLRIFDLSGREVTTLVDWELASGMHSFDWNGLSETGQPLSSGLYICRIEYEGLVETTGLCVLR